MHSRDARTHLFRNRARAQPLRAQFLHPLAPPFGREVSPVQVLRFHERRRFLFRAPEVQPVQDRDTQLVSSAATIAAIEQLRAAEHLASFLNRATARAREVHRLALITFAHGPGAAWATDCNHTIIMVPRFNGAAAAERELVEWSDALVVVGNPAKWSRLLRYASEKGIPVRYFDR